MDINENLLAELRRMNERLDARDAEAFKATRAPLRTTTRTVDEFIDEWLTSLSSNTRRTYQTHIDRFRYGISPVCDQRCPACITPTAIQLPPIAGRRIGGRRYEFECTCSCSDCVKSRITLVSIAERTVNDDAFTFERARQIVAVARRIAIKSGKYDNAHRAKRGLPNKAADGAGAEETAVAALRALYKAAAVYTGVALDELPKPKRGGRRRRALADFELLELERVAATGGTDPELDQLIVEFVIATGSRRQGTINVTLGDIRPAKQMIGIRDKYETTTDMPVSTDLIVRLIAHAIRRGGRRCDPRDPAFDPDQPVFWMSSRARGGSWVPLTSRHIDTLVRRWQTDLEWAGDEQVALHHLRHTMAERIKATYGQHYAQKYLRHTDKETTDRYGACTDEMLAGALGELLGFAHPLTDGVRDRRQQVLREYGLSGD